MLGSRNTTRRAASLAAALTSAAAVVGTGQPASGAHTQVTAVTASAFGYHADEITLFGGAQSDTGPIPTVSLASDASNSPQTATASTGLVQYGPATLFTSDQITVSATGSLGTTGSATTSSEATNVNKAMSQPSTGSEVLTADKVASTCTASASAIARSTTISNGTLRTDSGLDSNADGDYDDTGDHAPVVVALPTDPAPGAFYDGHIHLSATSRDDFRVVLNEQVTNLDGSRAVNAVHEYFGTSQQSVLKGHLLIAQSLCAATTAPGSNAAPVAGDDSYEAASATALSVAAPGVLANDTDADGGALAASSPSDPPGGNVVLNADGSFTYTPDAGFSGTDSFTYTVTDDHGATDTGAVSVVVAPPPPADPAVTGIVDTPDPVAPGDNVTYTITVANLGSHPASGVTLVSTLSNARFVSATTSDGDSCPLLKGKAKGITCNLGTIDSAASKTVAIVATAPRKTGTMSVSSTVSSTSDTDATNNSSSESTSIVRP